MDEWKPKPKTDAKTEDMNLTGEEGFVLSRVDGSTSLKHLVAVTGLPEGRVRQILQKLVRQGAVDDPSAEPSPAQKFNPSAIRAGLQQKTAVDEISEQELKEILGATMDDQPAGSETQEVETVTSVPADVPLEPQLDEVSATDAPIPDDPIEATADDGASDDDEQPKSDDAEDEAEEANYRKLFNEVLSKLEGPEREARARSSGDPELMALCFDPLPAVIRGIFENSKAGIPHARMVARVHRTPQGIDVVMARGEFFRDAQVQRFLLQNTMLQEPQLKKLLQTKRLADVYKISISREIPERNRQKSRNVLRSKWSTAEGEERAGLVFTTEGRCLLQLTGLPFDSNTTMLLCAKTYNSTLLIQNLARFGATPPAVLAHLMRQAVVKRQAHLRTLIKQHPNCPSDVKRQA